MNIHILTFFYYFVLFFFSQITSNGVFSFEEVNITQLQFLQSQSSNTLTSSQSSATPLIATLWTLTPSEQDGNRTLYTRVAQDNTTLGLVRDMIAVENTALSDYQPTVAIVVTWTRELMVINQIRTCILYISGGRKQHLVGGGGEN